MIPVYLSAFLILKNPVRFVHYVDCKNVFVVLIAFAEFFYIGFRISVGVFFADDKFSPARAASKAGGILEMIKGKKRGHKIKLIFFRQFKKLIKIIPVIFIYALYFTVFGK